MGTGQGADINRVNDEIDIGSESSYFGSYIISSDRADVINMQIPAVNVVIAECLAIVQIDIAYRIECVGRGEMDVLEELDIVLSGDGNFVLAGNHVGG